MNLFKKFRILKVENISLPNVYVPQEKYIFQGEDAWKNIEDYIYGDSLDEAFIELYRLRGKVDYKIVIENQDGDDPWGIDQLNESLETMASELDKQ